jgi:DNA polymerase bacteriophage-type
VVIYVDFETRSRCDLSVAGAWRYSRHASTEVIVMSWAVNDGDPRVWYPDPLQPEDVPVDLLAAVEGIHVWCAFNAQFEQAIWKNVLLRDFPSLPMPAQWIDAQDVALQAGLPDTMDTASRVLSVNQNTKDKQGHALMMKMCCPGRKGYHWKPADLARLGEYCQQDVRVTREIIARLGMPAEPEVIALDRKINSRGFRIDRPLATAGRRMAAELRDVANAELVRLTNGAIPTPASHAKIKKWARIASSAKDGIENALATMSDTDPRRPVIQIIADCNRSSVSKFDAALASADPDTDRIYGALQYHQAFTGRWAGRGFQPQNLPRGKDKNLVTPTPKRAEAMLAVLAGDVDAVRQLGNPLDVLTSMIRACIVPADGHRFVAADFSSIEARGVLWLAGEFAACEALRAGADIYVGMASHIFGVHPSQVTSDQRQIGKSAILGCGYGMGSVKFQINAKTSAEIAAAAVSGYRSKYPGVPRLWQTLESMFRAADGRRGPMGVRVVQADDRRRQIVLPSGRRMTYWDVQDDGDRLSYMAEYKKNWTRVDTWGGKITENVVSGIAADLLRASMLRADAAGWRIVLTVHDEIICEQADGRTADELAAVMSDITDVPWAAGFPLAAEGWEGERFQK